MLVICIRIRMIRFGCSFLSENEDDAFFVFFTRECFPNVFTSMLTFWMDLHQQLSKRICFAVVVYYAYIYMRRLVMDSGNRSSGFLSLVLKKKSKKDFFSICCQIIQLWVRESITHCSKLVLKCIIDR